MTPHRRIVDVSVPNATDVPVAALVRIAPTTVGIKGLGFDRHRTLKASAYGLSTDLCERAAAESLPRELKLEIGPYDTAVVRVIVETMDPEDGTPAYTAFAVTDTRGGTVVGGVTVVAATAPPLDVANPPPRDPCPLTIADGIYTVEMGASPANRSTPGTVPTDRPRQLVAPVVNTTTEVLKDAVVYLEHLDASDVAFEPVTWTLGNMEPGAMFWATWTVDARNARPGEYEASVVVLDDGHEAIRLRPRFRVTPRGRK